MSAINADDPDVLRELLSARQPVLSAYFDLETRPEEEDVAEERWQALAAGLAQQGADPDALRALTREVLRSLPGPGVLAAFAGGSDLVFSTRMPDSRQGDLVVQGPLPHLLPLLEWRQDHPARVLAVVDRMGADIEAYPPGTTAAIRQTVAGSDDEIERNAPGGWSQGRYQHRAEDSWEHNAKRVAEVLTEDLSRVSAHLLLLAGDVRALQYLTKHLPTWVNREVSIRRVSGGRSRDGALQERIAQVSEETHRAAGEETRALLRRMAEERHPGGRTVEGFRETLAALARGQVGTLVVAYDPQDRRTAWYGPGPTDVSDSRETLRATEEPLTRAPLMDVVVRAALLTGADVRVVAPGAPDAPAQGVGALCRYTGAPQPVPA